MLEVFAILISVIGTLLLVILNSVLNQIKEVKQEIKILQSLDGRIKVLESQMEHFDGCKNYVKGN